MRRPRMWDVEAADQFTRWYRALGMKDLEAVNGAVAQLEHYGPGLHRPIVGDVKISRHKNMKELIVKAHDIRILFAFDPRRTALLLLGGSKTDQWEEWYRENVPVADQLWDEHLQALREEQR